jgi:hypothetical protein
MEERERSYLLFYPDHHTEQSYKRYFNHSLSPLIILETVIKSTR